MAPNTLNELYKSRGQTLPPVSARAADATAAGIQNYTGTAEQNSQLLKYMSSTPNQGNGNVITPESLQTETPIEVKRVPDASAAGITAGIGALVKSTKESIAADEAKFAQQSAELAARMKEAGDTSAFDESVYRDTGVDEAKKLRDSILTKIESEQLSNMAQIEDVRNNFRGTVSGAGSEIERRTRENATNMAKYGIALSAANRNYDQAFSWAQRLIDSNTSKIRADIESRQFVLQQLGTKLADDKATSLQFQLRQLDREDQYYADAISNAQEAIDAGTVDPAVAMDAMSKLASGEMSISQFYTELGSTDNTLGNVGGYDITSYATDPQHEIKVQSIYDTLPELTDAAAAEKAIKSRAPGSPITGKMVMDAALQYNVDPKLMVAIMAQDSSLGTAGKGARTFNPGNVGNDDAGNEVNYGSWDKGVEAVAKWLNNHRSKGVYRGEFASTIGTIINAGPGSEANKQRDENAIRTDIANGNWEGAYAKLENGVSKVLTGVNKTDFDARRQSVKSAEQLQEKLDAFEAAGGNTNILKGTYEQIWSKLGMVSDPALKSLAVDLRMSLQKYRSDISGAAFSEQEAKDYESVNPSASNTLDLNTAILSGMTENFRRQVDATVDAVAQDDGIGYIREYARNGGGPNSKQNNVKFSTPSGNSFVIVGDGETANFGGNVPNEPPDENVPRESSFFSKLSDVWSQF